MIKWGALAGRQQHKVEMFMTDLGIMFGRVMLQGLMLPLHLHKQFCSTLSILHIEVLCSVSVIRCNRKRPPTAPTDAGKT